MAYRQNEIIEFVKANPGVGLFEVSNAMFELDGERWKKNVLPLQSCCRTCDKSLGILTKFKYLRAENPDGKRKIYFAGDA